MVEEGRPCPDVLIQLAAVRAAIDRTSRLVLEDHIGASSGQGLAESCTALRLDLKGAGDRRTTPRPENRPKALEQHQGGGTMDHYPRNEHPLAALPVEVTFVVVDFGLVTPACTPLVAWYRTRINPCRGRKSCHAGGDRGAAS